MSLLERLIDPQAEFVDIAVHDNDVMMRSGACTVYSRLVEGRFPRYRDVIPRSGNVNVPLPVAPFFAAVRRPRSSQTKQVARISCLTFMLTLSSQASTIGESKIELPIEYDHEEVKITFDPKYVADF
ncbi:MAG: DNA polymerase III subunit beta [Planctomycetaceae bacterium]